MNNNRGSRNHNNYDHRLERQERTHQPRKYSKGMILLKSSVFALFIVLVVLLAAFEIIKHRKESTVETVKCDKIKTITLLQNVESLEVNNGIITILTKVNAKGEQEIVRLGAECGSELNKIIIKSQK